MDIANYVNKVGDLINQSTKYNAKLDRVSITNLILLSHLESVRIWAESKIGDETYDITQDDVNKIVGYMNCLKKEINFYPEAVVDDDCILTEVEEYIIQE